MYKNFISSIILTLSLLLSVNYANAQGLNDILNGLGNVLGGNGTSSQSGQSNNKGNSGLGGSIGNLLEGVFSSSNITVRDMAGVWTSNGPAVCFQSDNFLQKAGGIAAASMIENKLSPYYDQYGLNGAVITINTDNTFTMQLKKLTLKGTISPSAEQGTFEFNFTALGMRLGSFKTYAQKSFNTLHLMFDASKLKTLISGIAKLTGISLAKTAAKLLDSYEGLCVGFRMERTGNVDGQDDSQNNNLGNLINILGGKKGQSTPPATDSSQQTDDKQTGTQQNNTQQTGNQQTDSATNSGLGTLINILSNKRKK